MTKNIAYQDLKHLLTPRKKDANKGDFGHVLILGGDIGYAGAPRLTAEAALRTGAGLVSVITHQEHLPILLAKHPEIMGIPFGDKRKMKIAFEKATVIAIGPGLGQTHFSKQLWFFALKQNKPLIVDADALNLLAKKNFRHNHWILTPHAGEAARLLNTNIQTVQENREKTALALQKKFGGYVILKGSGSIFCDEQANLFICQDGNPGMASGGMGDLLTGIIAALVAQGFKMKDAALLGMCLHANAGDLAAENGERGLVASDLLPFLRILVNPV